MAKKNLVFTVNEFNVFSGLVAGMNPKDITKFYNFGNVYVYEVAAKLKKIGLINIVQGNDMRSKNYLLTDKGQVVYSMLFTLKEMLEE